MKLILVEFIEKIHKILPDIKIEIMETSGRVRFRTSYENYFYNLDLEVGKENILLKYDGVVLDEEYFVNISKKKLILEIALNECQYPKGGENFMEYLVDTILEHGEHG